MSGASLSVRERDHGIHFYLDIDSNPLPEKFNVPTLFTQIETSLKLYDAEKFLYRVVAYGDFTPYGGVEAFQVLRGNISEDRFKFVHLPTRIAVCRDKEKNCQKQKPGNIHIDFGTRYMSIILRNWASEVAIIIWYGGFS
ncbi:uncharacterized protein LOC9301871 [Arabidopsis lyrata subsp. lyrata]|uniref:uncharacterized protein LOC9301871 n=1 Tax=Arabidopsis lyrata subsp. lyrata TaxID=81972 RepID=UPI000A29E3FC|nr:uncharacterized protein LOC9301871 [Arabidopsis lyrata subsp. lyrata]|eukprot:XP_020886079.1 uncharacterized protein LOC9301871 [Arabidopsis lyrata subsp. lyrata]